MTDPRTPQSAVKILHLRASPFIGSPEKLLLAQLPYLKTSGLDCEFGIFDEQEPAENEFCRCLTQRGYNAFLLDQRLVRLGGALRTIIERLRRRNIGLLCAHDYKSTFYGFLAGLATKTPVVVVCHGRTTHDIKSRFYEALDSCILRWVDAVVVVSQAMRADLIRSGVAERKICVITNGIDIRGGDRESTGQFRHELGIEEADPLVVFVGRLSKEKGLYVLMESAKRVRQVIPRVCVALVGEGPERHSLHQVIHKAGLTGVVQLMGYRREVDDVFQDMDLLVLPSFREGMPLVILESFARGRPVIASHVGGIPEIVENNVNGILVPSGDANALADAIIVMIQNPGRARSMGEAGRVRVATYHTVERQVTEFVKLFMAVRGA
jgi:glycosyltransferase involved in cell wall biosynthesis